MQELYEILIKELQANGLIMKTTSVKHVHELEEDISYLKGRSLLNDQFYNENLYWLNFNYKDTMPDAESIIVISKPQFKTLLHFQREEKSYSIPIPPTYVYSKVCSSVEEILSKVLSQYNFGIRKTSLPAKLLAVRTGLGMYGRNNICYIHGMGSFHRIFTYYSNMPLIEDNWQEKKVMPDCNGCERCIKACPTKCIDSGRFLIHAEQCITNFNEKDGEFPEWLDKNWHNSIVGCMRCQIACPQNRDFINRTEGEVAFTPEETNMILEKLPYNLLPYSLKQKLADVDITEYYGILSRNLSLLISKTT